MNITAFLPYGLSLSEGHTTAVLLRYLQTMGLNVTELQCNGAFSVCDRGSEWSWKRTLTSCLRCQSEQARMAAWIECGRFEISRYVEPEKVEQSRRYLAELDDKALMGAEWNEEQLFPFVRHSFQLRFGATTEPNVSNRQHMGYLRRLMLAAISSIDAFNVFLNSKQPDLVLSAGGEGFLSQTFEHVLMKRGVRFVQVRLNLKDRCVDFVKNSKPGSSEIHSCPLLLENMLDVRREVNTWDNEVIRLLDELQGFLELEHVQLSFPMAQS